jgi:hypothetical protein
LNRHSLLRIYVEAVDCFFRCGEAAYAVCAQPASIYFKSSTSCWVRSPMTTSGPLA